MPGGTVKGVFIPGKGAHYTLSLTTENQSTKKPKSCIKVIKGGNKTMNELENSQTTQIPKKSLKKIEDELQAAKENVQPGQKYFHHKNQETCYTITDISTNVHTQELMVHYTDGTHSWSRDYKDFTSTVEKDGEEIPKFGSTTKRTLL